MLLAVFALGSAGIAVWIAFRFPSVAPQGLRDCVIRIGAALLVTQLISVPLSSALDPSQPARAFAGLFVLALPALTYSFLAGFWLIKVTQGIFSRYSH
jgi:hypothetical protein